MLDEVERQHGVEHRHLDALALAGALPVEQRRQHRLDDGQRGHLVAERRRHEVGHAERGGVQPRVAGEGLDDVVVGREVGGTAVAAEAVRLAVDEPGSGRRDVLVGEAEPRIGSGRRLVTNTSLRSSSAQERLLAPLVLQVEPDRPLVPVQVEGDARQLLVRPAAHAPAGVAAVGLDLHHVGAEVAQHLRGVGPHDHGREVQHPHPVEGTGRRHDAAGGPTSTTGTHVSSVTASAPARRATTR